jgi:hypothetical protein
MNATAFDLWQKQPKFTIPDEWVATHQRDVQRLVLIDESKHPGDQFLAFKVRKLAQLGLIPEMRRIKCVTSWAPQGTFLCDLN